MHNFHTIHQDLAIRHCPNNDDMVAHEWTTYRDL